MSHSRASQISGRSIISILPRHRTCGTFASKVMGIAVLWLSIAWYGHAATYYVDASRVDDSGAGTSWATAKMTIQAAVDLTIDGDTVVVTNGVYNTGATATPGYALKNRVVITNAVTVRSTSGPSETIIEGSGTNWFNTSSAVRCVYMKRGVLAGFTLAKGATLGSGSSYDHSGGGVSMSDAIAGTLVTNCTISGCMAYRGGGSYGGTLNNCALSGNTADYSGGGSCYGTLYNCALSGNTASGFGGGSDGGTMYNCTLSGNSASYNGGGARGGTLYNCTLSGNSAASSGGGYCNGTLYNCTLTGNTAATSGGGLFICTIYNCIVWDNRNSNGIGDNYSGVSFFYSCTTPLPSGPGNISLDPLFCDTTDYRLQPGSPCVNTGSNGYVLVLTDLNGAPRIQDGTVDMGAYEGVGRCAAPAFSPVTGRSYTNSVTITLSCTTAGVSMRYTTDGSDPTLDSNVYAGVFVLINNTTVRAKAFKSGMLESETATAAYTVIQTVAAPAFSLQSGTLGTNTLDVTLTCATIDATVRYTLDGAEPTADSTGYTGTITVTQSAVIKAKAFKSGMADSDIAEATFEIIHSAATPVFAPVTGTSFSNSLDVTITCATQDAAIRYTLDGSAPTADSQQYTHAVTIAKSTTVMAKAFKAGFVESATASASYHRTVLYVDAARPDDSGDGSSWQTAKKTIQAAVDLAAVGDTVMVTNGVYDTGVTVTPGYALKNRLVITNNITVRSVNGPEFTVIEGSGINWYNTSSAVRCVYMKRGVLDGFTLRGGATYGANLGASDYYDRNGGGVNAYNAVAGTVVTNCLISGCRASNGGGSYYGTLNNCTLSGNSASYGGGSGYCTLNNCALSGNSAYEGGGSSAGTLNNCTLSGNSASYGGGSRNGTLNNCKLSGNTASDSGGGSGYCTLNNCALSGNTASDSGGGSYNGTLNNCTLSGNAASRYGGGSSAGTLNNCTLSGNSASYGGGSSDGKLNNCTLSGNTASRYGGGSCYGTLNNCIVWENRKTDGTVDNHTNSVFYYSCTTPLPSSGAGNIDFDPMLVDAANPRLRSGSPCIDAGDNAYVTLSTDLAGDPRIQNGTVDMGAYEGAVVATAVPSFSPPSGTRFTESLIVTVTCSTADAVMRYTLDGSEPTEGSGVYSSPLAITESVTVRVKAYKEGLVAAQASAGYIKCVSAPVFSLPSGSVGTNTLAVAITCDTPGAVIRYTLDNSEPSESSAEYTSVLTLTTSRTIKAKAYKQGLEASATSAAGYTVIYSVAAPMFSPEPGKVSTNSAFVSIWCPTAGATIRYTLDGTDPDTSSPVYGSPVYLTQTTVIKARGYRSGWADSDVAAAEYRVMPRVATPVLLPADGTYFSGLRKVAMSCKTEGAQIRYTADGSEPTVASTLYSGAFNLSQTTTVMAKAFKGGWADSGTASATYFRLSSLSEAVDVTNLIVSTGGYADWFFQTNVTHDGSDTARSGAIGDNQTTWMETTVTGPGTLSFWWKTSCEDDPDADNWDFGEFSVDGQESRRIDGITEWQHVTIAIGDGQHTLRWTYRKDDMLADGEDCMWVDQLTFAPDRADVTVTTPVPVPFAWVDQYPVLLSGTGGDYEAAANADVDGDGHAAWQEYVSGSIPTNRDSVFRSSITTSQGFPVITWTPDMGGDRVYEVEGKETLTDAVWSPTNAASRFFRVKVSLP